MKDLDFGFEQTTCECGLLFCAIQNTHTDKWITETISFDIIFTASTYN